MTLNTRKLVLFLLVAFFVAGCGYRFSGTGEYPGGMEKIYVEMMKNPTSQTGIERIVTNQLIAEFTRQRESSLVSTPGQADAVLKGIIAKVQSKTISRVNTEMANQREVTLTIDLKLVTPDGQVIWAAKGLSDRQAYDVSDNTIENDRNKNAAIALVSRRLAERAYSRLTDNF